MPLTLAARLGRSFLDSASGVKQAVSILDDSMAAVLRLAFLNHAVAWQTARQIVFTGVQAIPVVAGLGLAIGSVAVHFILRYLTEFGGYDYVGKVLTTSVLHEIGPLTVATVLLLRSGAAVISEIGIMQLRGEMNTLEAFGVDRTRFIYVPRLLALSLCAPCLTLIFSLVALVGGFFVLGYLHDITFGSYLDQLVQAATLTSLGIVLFKPMFMGAAAAVVCIRHGAGVTGSQAQIPMMLIRGMMLAMLAILAIEIAFTFLLSV
ncbi:MAG: phospholipid/cholesterol/gamma-HCH transport system permease protein [Desulfovibrionales bacterium]|nr:phospholipid/cholesterol/gamma-HCH transport system permease protein [Desulfovibrionales bacterium]